MGSSVENLKPTALPVYSLCFMLVVEEINSQIRVLITMPATCYYASPPC